MKTIWKVLFYFNGKSQLRRVDATSRTEVLTTISTLLVDRKGIVVIELIEDTGCPVDPLKMEDFD